MTHADLNVSTPSVNLCTRRWERGCRELENEILQIVSLNQSGNNCIDATPWNLISHYKETSIFANMAINAL